MAGAGTATKDALLARGGHRGLDGQIEISEMRLYGQPDDAAAVLHDCRAMPMEPHSPRFEPTCHLPHLRRGTTANVDFCSAVRVACQSCLQFLWLQQHRLCAGLPNAIKYPPPCGMGNPPLRYICPRRSKHSRYNIRMTENSSRKTPALPRPPIVLRVGVVGHRPHRLAAMALTRAGDASPDGKPPSPDEAMQGLYAALTQTVLQLLQDITEAASPTRSLYGPPGWAGLYSNEPPGFRLVIGAAPGADHVVMKIGKCETLLSMNWGIDVILPWEKATFIKEANEDLAGQKQAIIAEADWDDIFKGTSILELPGLDRKRSPEAAEPAAAPMAADTLLLSGNERQGAPPEANKEGQKLKEELLDQLSFAAAADFFLRQVDVLIAILGPDSMEKPAGTAAIADRAVQSRIPVIRINPEEPQLVPTAYFGRVQPARGSETRLGQCGIIKIIDTLLDINGADGTEQRRRFLAHASSGGRGDVSRAEPEIEPLQTTQSNGKPSWLRQVPSALSSLFANIRSARRRREPEATIRLAGLAVALKAANESMVRFRRTQCWVLVLLPVFLAAAATLAIVGLALQQIILQESAKKLKPWLVGGEIVAFGATALVFAWAARRQIHLRFVEFSALHESLRQAQLLQPLADHDPIRVSVGEALNWREWYLRAMVRSLPLPRGLLGRERQKEILRGLKQSEVIERRRTLEKLRDEDERWERRLRQVATWLFWVGLVFATMLLGFLSIFDPPTEWLVGAIALLIALLPVGGGAMLAIRHGFDFQGRAKAAGDTLKAIARLETAFDFHDDYPTFDVTRKLLREAVGMAAADLDDFLVQEALRDFELSA